MPKRTCCNRPLAQLIQERYSCRTFDGCDLAPESQAALVHFLSGLKLPFKNALRFGIIDSEQVRSENVFSTGSYGMIKGVRYYLSALVKKGAPRGWEDVGFALQAGILHATSLDLATCWIGGIFDRKRFGKTLGIAADELLPAVVAVGRPAARRSWRDRVVRWSARGDQRKAAAEIFFIDGWQSPLRYPDFPQWAPVLENVRLAPSASNKQPWRIVFHERMFHFYLNRHKAYSAMMPFADLQRIDMGIAMCHFELVAQELGLSGEWRSEEPALPGTPANFEYIVTFVICNS